MFTYFDIWPMFMYAIWNVNNEIFMPIGIEIGIMQYGDRICWGLYDRTTMTTRSVN